jgi:hypothetical protein
MKSFTEYLKEEKEAKKYTFKVKVAGDLPDNCEDCMETALQKYQVCKFSKGKSTPIQASLLEFPNIKNSSMTIFEVELDYPTTSAVLSELLANCTGIARDCIRVRTPLEEANAAIEQENVVDEKTDRKALLSQDYGKENNQSLVGDKHVLSLLKDLTKSRKDTQPTQYKGVNDVLLAKKLHQEKATEMPKAGPARGLFASKGKQK